MITIEDKLNALRIEMQKHKIDAYIIPGTDFHFGEYLAPFYKTREWISGFNGSAGTVVVTKDKAGLWTDFRYYIAAEKVLEDTSIDLHKVGMPDVLYYNQWLAAELSAEDVVIGFDGRQLSLSEQRDLESAFFGRKLGLVLDLDLLGLIWTDRPAMPSEEVYYHVEEFCKESAPLKLEKTRAALEAAGCNTLIVSTLDDIAWLTNLRGADVTYNPVFTAFLLLTDTQAVLYTDCSRIPGDISQQLSKDGFVLKEYDALQTDISSLPPGASVLISPSTTNSLFYNLLPDSVRIVEDKNPIAALKAVKTFEEIENISDAMVQDGLALVRFWRWLESMHEAGEEIDEFFTGIMLRRFRSEQENFIDESFAPIIGWNENGAIVHYSAPDEGGAEIKGPGVLLVDSGGQYLNGTTDITRVFNLGSNDPEIIKDYTLVLKGHLALSRAVFPKGTRGYQLDTIARQYLWSYGKNYGHGTGHGVGYFLGVHEGPQRISPQPIDIAIEPGMLCSNEPGIYREGKYGIRIENLIVAAKNSTTEFGDFNHFETLTLFPYDLSLIDVELLTEEEKLQINGYHENVIKALSPHVGIEELEWLRRKCRAL